MKLNLVLKRSNLNEAGGKDFDFSKDFITYREVVYSSGIEKLSSKEIEKFKYKVFEQMMYTFPRNGFEYINDKRQESLNVLILDYPLTQDWEKDVNIQNLLKIIESYFEVKEYSDKTQTLDMSTVEHTLEIDSYGGYDLENIEYLQNLFDEYEIEYKTIYEKTSEINAGASSGDLKVIFQIIGKVADVVTVSEFFKKKFPYESILIQNMGKVKKQISEYYEIHESQLKLESINYDDEKRETIYLFTSRNYLYRMIYDKGELKSTSREEKNR